MKDSSAANAEGTSLSEEFKDETVSVKELCDILEMTRPPVQRLLSRKAILSFMRGGRRRIKKTEIRRFLEQGDHPDAIREKAK